MGSSPDGGHWADALSPWRERHISLRVSTGQTLHGTGGCTGPCVQQSSHPSPSPRFTVWGTPTQGPREAGNRGSWGSVGLSVCERVAGHVSERRLCAWEGRGVCACQDIRVRERLWGGGGDWFAPECVCQYMGVAKGARVGGGGVVVFETKGVCVCARVAPLPFVLPPSHLGQNESVTFPTFPPPSVPTPTVPPQGLAPRLSSWFFFFFSWG